MSFTNLYLCALIKDHKMRQIMNNLYLLFLIFLKLALFCFKKKYFDLFFLKNLRLYPPPPPPINI